MLLQPTIGNYFTKRLKSWKLRLPRVYSSRIAYEFPHVCSLRNRRSGKIPSNPLQEPWKEQKQKCKLMKQTTISIKWSATMLLCWKKKEKKRKESKRKQRSLSREKSSSQEWPPLLFFFWPTSHLSMLLENFTVVYWEVTEAYLQICFQFFVVYIQWILGSIIFSTLQQTVGHFDVKEVIQHSDFSLWQKINK